MNHLQIHRYSLPLYSKSKWPQAKVAQLVERDLAKVEVAGSNPVFRSIRGASRLHVFLFFAGMVELVDTQDLKSCGLLAVWVQVPLLVLNN